MKKNLTYLFSTLAILAFLNNVLVAQEAATVKEKRVVVTIRHTNADGSTSTSTVMKSGEDAKNFDVQKYIKEQTKDKPDAVVIVKDKIAPPQYKVGKYTSDGYNSSQNHEKSNHYTVQAWQNYNDKGFLGVSELDSDTKLSEGVRVHITRNSGAAKAGLKDDDVILQLNKTPINSFRDISTFMRSTKPDDKVEVVYDRDGATKTTTATLGKQQETWVQTVEQEKEACLGVYTSSRVLAEQRGAIIEDFTSISAAEEAKMQVGDLITQVNGVRVKTHQDVWDEIAKYKPNTTVTVSYLRENAPKQIRATLKACKPNDEQVIVVPKIEESPKVTTPALTNLGRLELENFSASPNPTRDMVNIKFSGASVPTSVSFYDLTGKVLFQQNINDFKGEYSQRFDLNEYAKGVVVVKVQQGDKVFSKQIVVN